MPAATVTVSEPNCLTVARAQQPVGTDPFESLSFMIGRWEGTSEGQPGKAKVQREYRRALNSRFIHVRNRSDYAPQERNPKGEIHEDEGWFSFDRARKRLVLRQFHLEGFVNQYVRPGRGCLWQEARVHDRGD